MPDQHIGSVIQPFSERLESPKENPELKLRLKEKPEPDLIKTDENLNALIDKRKNVMQLEALMQVHRGYKFVLLFILSILLLNTAIEFILKFPSVLPVAHVGAPPEFTERETFATLEQFRESIAGPKP